MGETKHGLKWSVEYNIWCHMRQRCYNPNNLRYEYYGGRGITICERWNTFINFYNDMGPKPEHLDSIDRIDVNGNYEPSNCRWASRKTQAQNKRQYKDGHSLGNKNAMARLNEEKVIEIRNSTLKTRILAEKYNVAQATIRAAKKGTNWKHIK